MTQKPSAVDPKILQFQDNLKKTDFGIQFGRALFSEGNLGLNPKFIAASLKKLGLDIPKGVQIPLETAQLVTSGQSVYSGAKNYQGFDDIKSVTKPSLESLNLSISLLQQIGWLKLDSESAQMIKVGTNVALIIASFGLDWKSWVSLALDITSFESMNEAKAKSMAHNGVSKTYMALVNPQIKEASSLISEYQSGQSGLTTFGLVAKMAEVAPDLWPQFFPEFQTWAPVYDQRIEIRSESRTWYGSTSSHTASKTWKTIAGYTKDQLREWVFLYLIEPYLYPYLLAQRAYQGEGRIPLMMLFPMMLLAQRDYISANDSQFGWMLETGLSFSDLGSDSLIDFLEGVSPFVEKEQEFAIYGGGLSVVGKKSSADLKKEFLSKYKDLLVLCDQSGRIDILNQAPSDVLKAKMREISSYPVITENGVWREAEKSFDPYAPRGDSGLSRPSGPGAAWRFTKNLFGAMGMLADLSRDKYFEGWNGGRLSEYEFLGSISDFEATYKDLQLKMVLRRTNTMAMSNVAFFFDSTPGRLKRVGNGQFRKV